MRYIAPLCALVLATSAHAQNFTVSLAGKTLGTLAYSKKGSITTLKSTLDQTPMGVFNGTFVGVSKGSWPKTTFTGDSKSSRKQRRVIVKFKGGRAQSVDITPIEELTELSDPMHASANVFDPVRVVAALINSKGCPTTLPMYDGRREVRITPEMKELSGDTLTCRMSYKVIKGPGHLSPLGISSAKMMMTYDKTGGGQKLRQIKISSGVFRLSLDRTN